MPNINITIKNKVAQAIGFDVNAVCDNTDYTILFTFDSEWDSFQLKTARFAYGSSYTDVVFSGNTCSMPKLENVLSVKVGVFAGNLSTTTPAILPVLKSIRSAGGSPAAPSQSVYDQIMAALNEKANAAQSVAYAGKVWTVGADGNLTFTEIGGGGGASSWNDLTGKPFSTIGNGLKVVNGALAVDAATAVEEDNTKPVTSGAVFTEIGNIEVLLAAL